MIFGTMTPNGRPVLLDVMHNGQEVPAGAGQLSKRFLLPFNRGDG